MRGNCLKLATLARVYMCRGVGVEGGVEGGWEVGGGGGGINYANNRQNS